MPKLSGMIIQVDSENMSRSKFIETQGRSKELKSIIIYWRKVE
jgi:hypothetical protein